MMHLVTLARADAPPLMMRPEAARLIAVAVVTVVGVASVAAGPGASAAAPPTTPPIALSDARAVRARGCTGHAGVRATLRHVRTLDEAAARWAGGSRLQAAVEAAGYRSEQSRALHVSGNADALHSALARDLCPALTNARFRDIGAMSHGRDIWIILAAPFTPPSGPPAAVAAAVLARVNAARAMPRRCGGRRFAAAPPLRLNARLSRAAAAHARDMLEHDYFAHAGRDGSSPADRIAAAGYRYHLAGENIAFGPESAAQAVQGWLNSPGHCANIMDAGFRDIGVAFASNRRGAPRIYWVQDFAAPRAAAAR